MASSEASSAMNPEGLWTSPEGQAVAVLAGLLLSLLLLSLLLRLRRRKLRLPPRPFPSLPLLGDVLYLRRQRSSSSFRALRDRLGPIFTLYVGNTPFIYITTAALAHEALVRKGLLFAARPLLPSRALFTSNFRGISSATYGPHWRLMRRNLVQEMLSVPKILSFAPVRCRVLDSLVDRISASGGQSEGIIMLYPHIRTAMFQLLLLMCFGFEMPPDKLSEISAVIDEMLVLSFGDLSDMYPLLGLLRKTRRNSVCAVRARQVQIFTSHIQKHKELAELGQLEPGSYLETLLHMDSKTVLSIDDLVTLCNEFLVGGTDSTVTTLEWAMAHLVANLQIQDKLHSQILDVVGDRKVHGGDLPNLPYLQAIARETLRLHPPGHFVLPHAVSEPCKIAGYDIPANSIIQFHLVSISRDAEVWDEPMKFKPERFLLKDVDITGSKEVTMIPFGAGRRICPGLGLASIHLELFIARLVQSFEWANPPGCAFDFEEKLVFTVRKKSPLRAVVKERIQAKLSGV